MNCSFVNGRLFLACTIAFAVLVPASAQAETKTFVELSQGHTITTNGHFETKVQPDRALVIFSISSFDKVLSTAYSSNSASANHLIALADELKIEKTDVQTGAIQVHPEYPVQTLHRLA
jgi:uncharacterized protein YggE